MRTTHWKSGNVVISMLVAAALVILVLVSRGYMVRKTNGGKSTVPIKELVTAIHAYVQDSGGLLPAGHAKGELIPASRLREETILAFAALSRWSDGDIGAEKFWPGRWGLPSPIPAPNADGTPWLSLPMPNAYDWSAPGENALRASRPLVSERDPGIWQGKGIQVAFGDGHYEWTKAVPGTAETQPPIGPGTQSFAVYANETGDNVFRGTDDVGHGPAGSRMTTVGKGSVTRAFLK